MIEWILPLPFLAFGVFATFWRARAAHWFCESGKAAWRASLLGRAIQADRLYKEERARVVFLILGPFFLLIGLRLGWTAYQAFHGPGSPAATHEARLYLEHRFHDPFPGSFSVTSGPADAQETVHLRYALDGHTGYLLARWSRDHYEFSDSGPVPLPEPATPPAD